MSEGIQERLDGARSAFEAEMYAALDRLRSTGSPVEDVELGVPSFVHFIHEFAGLQVEKWLVETDSEEPEEERPKIDVLNFAKRRGHHELFDFMAEQFFLTVVSQPDDNGGAVSLNRFKEGGYIKPQEIPGRIKDAREEVEEIAQTLQFLRLFQREQAEILTETLSLYNQELQRAVWMDGNVKSWMSESSQKMVDQIGDSQLIAMLMFKWQMVLGKYVLALLTGAQVQYHLSGQTEAGGRAAFNEVLRQFKEVEGLILLPDEEKDHDKPNVLHTLCESVYVGATIKSLMRG